MTPRAKLQRAYELAFSPPALNQAWNNIKRNALDNSDENKELVDMALLLHQSLPESGFASQRALQRLALYQAKARAFGMVRFLRNIRKILGTKEPFTKHIVPGSMVRDLPLPAWTHKSRNTF